MNSKALNIIYTIYIIGKLPKTIIRRLSLRSMPPCGRRTASGINGISLEFRVAVMSKFLRIVEIIIFSSIVAN